MRGWKEEGGGVMQPAKPKRALWCEREVSKQKSVWKESQFLMLVSLVEVSLGRGGEG